MKAKELVGKLVTSNYLERRRIFPSGFPSGAKFKVVGYECDLGWAIIDADSWGWQSLDMHDCVTEKCKTYWYLRPCEITKVL